MRRRKGPQSEKGWRKLWKRFALQRQHCTRCTRSDIITSLLLSSTWDGATEGGEGRALDRDCRVRKGGGNYANTFSYRGSIAQDVPTVTLIHCGRVLLDHERVPSTCPEQPIQVEITVPGGVGGQGADNSFERAKLNPSTFYVCCGYKCGRTFASLQGLNMHKFHNQNCQLAGFDTAVGLRPTLQAQDKKKAGGVLKVKHTPGKSRSHGATFV